MSRWNSAELQSPRVVIPACLVLALVWALLVRYHRAQAVKRVTLIELERATKSEPFFLYRGVAGEHHRFQTLRGATYLVDRKEWELPASWNANRGAALFVTVKDGKLHIPDPKMVAEWMRRHPPPMIDDDDELSLPGEREEQLLVIRDGKSAEPTVLTLTSDGDWSDQDLGRLDRVLNDWLENERPGRERDAKVPADQRPKLRFDPKQSAADRKTIVIRAEHFRDEWCESLAHRLSKEFPFLWQLQVGSATSPSK